MDRLSVHRYVFCNLFPFFLFFTNGMFLFVVVVFFCLSLCFCKYATSSIPLKKQSIGLPLDLFWRYTYRSNVSHTCSIYSSATTNVLQHYLYIARLCILLHRCIWSHLVSQRRWHDGNKDWVCRNFGLKNWRTHLESFNSWIISFINQKLGENIIAVYKWRHSLRKSRLVSD